MKVAQELYEGVDIEGMGATGLITYMRTDSLRISDVAKEEAAQYILNRFGEKFLPAKPRVFKTKSNAQDGHEAIRPSMPSLSPEDVKASLTSDSLNCTILFGTDLWRRRCRTVFKKQHRLKFQLRNIFLKASGYYVDFEGFTTLYVESKDTEEEKSTQLPPLEKDMPVKCKELKKESALHTAARKIHRGIVN